LTRAAKPFIWTAKAADMLNAVGVTIYYVSDHGIWTLVGATSAHGGSTAYNHWMTSNAAYGIYNATVAYQQTYPGLVQANDMSLPYGGLFDIYGNWTAPHKDHWYGTAADIDGITGSSEVSAFLTACQNAGSDYFVQETNLSLHCHWSY
jgi:hypothetical protein